MKCEKYVDAFDREWQISVTPWEQAAIHESLGINVYDLVDHTRIEEESTDEEPVTLSSKFIGRLETDDRLLANIMWAICESQAVEQKVDKRDFVRGCTGEALDRAYLAVLGALSNFFRRPEQRLAVKRMAEALNRVHELQTEQAVEGINAAMKLFDPAKFVNEHSSSQQSQG